jgi:RNA-binding protein
MPSITSRQRAFLRSLAHPLKPVVQVGPAGVTDGVLTSLDEAFRTRELLKIRVLEAPDLSLSQVVATLGERRPDVEVVQTIGRVAALYRPFPDGPEIELP